MKTGMAAVRERIESVAALARSVGVGRSAVSQWKYVPARHIGKVAKFTGLPHHIIRPDLFYPDLEIETGDKPAAEATR